MTNSAPTLTGTLGTITNYEGYALAPVNGSFQNSITLNDILFTNGFADVDGTLTGIAITAAPSNGHGVLWFSTDNGANWAQVPSTVSDAHALLLAGGSTTTNRLYFQSLDTTTAASNYHGDVPNLFTFRAWDQTSGTSGQYADTTVNGDPTAFSTTARVVSGLVADVNDAPTLTLTTGLKYTNGLAISLFSNASVSGGAEDTGVNSKIKQVVLSVAGLKNGASEMLTIGGQDIPLVATPAGTLPNGMGTYIVQMLGTTAAKVTLNAPTTQGAAGWETISTNPVNSLINGITYKNTNATPLDGTRTISVTSILDLGGKSTANNPFLGENLSTFTGITTSVVIDKIAPAATGSLTIAEAADGLNLVEANSAAGTEVVVPLNGLTATDGTKPLIGDVLKVNFGGDIISHPLTLADLNAGSVSVTVPTATIIAHQGNVTVSATLTDAAGNVSAPASTLSITVDTLAPTQPTLALGTGVSNGATAAEAAAAGGVVLVTAELGATTVVTFTDGTNSVPVTVTGTGSPQAVTLTPAQVATLNNGTITASAVATDASGNPSPAGSIQFTLDTIAPATQAAPSVPANAATSTTTASVNADELASGTAVVVALTGTGAQAPAVGDKVNIIVDGVSLPTPYVLTQTDIDAHSATITVPKSVFDNVAVGQGNASVTATITDKAGNIGSASPATTIFVDSVAPNAPLANTISIPENVTGGGINSAEITGGTPLIVSLSGTNAAYGDKLTVDVDGIPLTITLNNTNAPSLTGNVTVTIPAATLTSANQGPATVTITLTDPAGNVSTPVLTSINIDTVAPVMPTISIAEGADGYLNAAEKADGTVVKIDFSAGSSIDGTQASAGDKITIVVESNFVLTQVDPDPLAAPVLLPQTSQNVNYTLTANDIQNGWANVPVSALVLTNAGQGVASFTAKITDAVGNVGFVSDPATVNIDTIAPNSISPAPTVAENANGGINIAEAANGIQVTVPLTGSEVAGEKVNVNINGVTTSHTLTQPDIDAHSFTVTAPTPTTDGSYPVTATLTDLAGNTSTPSTPVTILVDTAAPTALGAALHADTGTSSSDRITSDPVITISNTQAGATLEYSVNNGDTWTQLNGTETSITLPAGVYAQDAVQVRQTDSVGNISDVTKLAGLTVDTTAPAKPDAPSSYNDNVGAVMSATSTASSTDDNTPVVNLAPNLIGDVKAYVNNTLTPATYDSATGTLTFTSPLTDGSKAITYTLTDVAGNESLKSDPLNVIIDTAPPSTVTLTLGTGVSDGATSAEATAATGVVSIATTVGLSTAVTFTNGVHSITKTVLGNGSTAVPVVLDALEIATLTNGTISVSAVATSSAGTPSAPATASFVLDTEGPSAPSTAPSVTENAGGGINGTEAVDGTTVNVPLTGTGAVEGDVVNVIIDGVATPHTLTAGEISLGTASVTVPASVLTSAGQGPATVTTTITDGAGNVSSPSTPATITIDTVGPTAPVAPSVTENAGGGINGTEAVDGTTVDVPLTGTGAVEGDVVNVIIDGVATPHTLTAGEISLGTASVTVPASVLTSAGQGPATVTTTITDGAGNVSSPSTPATITIDTVGPTAPVAPSVTENAGGGINGTEAVDGTTVDVPLTGTGAVEGDVVNVIIDGVATPHTLTAGEISLGTASVTVPASVLTSAGQGPATVTTTITDGAGNVSSPSTPATITIDTVGPTAPVAPSVTENAGGGINGTEAVDGTTVDVPLTGTGAVEGDVVNVIIDGVATPHTLTAGEISLGTASVTVPASVLTSAGQGPATVTTTITDGAGNVSSPSTPATITIDTVGPTAPVAPSVTENAGGGINGTEAVDGTTVDVPLTGTGAVEGDVVNVIIDGVATPHTLTAGEISLGTASVTVPASVLTSAGQGPATVTTTITDGAGNVSSPSTPATITIDTVGPTAPVAPSVTENAGGGINGTEAVDGTTVDVPLTGTGAVEGDVVNVIIDGVATPHTLTAGEISLGTASVTVPASVLTSAGQGPATVTTTITDGAGNVSSPSTPATITIDTTAPTAPTAPASYVDNVAGIVNTASTASLTNDATPGVFVGTGLTDTPKLYDGTTVVPSTYDPITGTLTPTSSLGEGAHALKYTLTDSAGNEGAPSPALNVTVDTTAPTTSAYTLVDTGTSTSDGITKNPVVGVTVESGATWEYSVNGGANWTAGSGTSFTLADGVHAVGDVKVRQTDAAGNLQTTGIVTNAAAITIDTVLPVITSGGSGTAVSGMGGTTSSIVYATNATDNGGSITYSLTGADAAKFTINAAGEVKFAASPNHANPTDVGGDNVYNINVVATDVAGNAATQAVDITVNNAASVVTPDSATHTYIENAAGLLVNSGITITDVDSTTLTGATVKISNGLTAGDALSFTSANGITGSYNAGTGVLTLSGSATVAQYQVALQSVKYSSTSDTLNINGETRTVEWQVNDGSSVNNLSTVATSVVNVQGVNDLTQLDISGNVSGNYPAGMGLPFLSASPYEFNPTWSSPNTHIDFTGAAQIEVDFAMADGYFGAQPDGNFSTPSVLEISAGGTVYAKVTGSTTGYAHGTGMYTVTYLNGASGKLNGNGGALQQGHVFFSPGNPADNTQLVDNDQYLKNATPWDNLLINLPAGATNNGALQFNMTTTADYGATFSDEKVWFQDARVYNNTSVSHLNTILENANNLGSPNYDYLSTFVMDYPAGAVDLTYTDAGVTSTVHLVTAGDDSGWGWRLPFGTTIPKTVADTIEAHSTASYLGHYDFWTEDQGPVSVVADNMTITDIDGAMLTSGSVSIAHAELGDRLLINGVVVHNGDTGTIGTTGVTYTATVTNSASTSGPVTIALSGAATHAAYINALKAISFDSTSQSSSGTVESFTMDGSGNIVRNIAITLNDGDNSNTATNVIIVNNMNDQPSILAGHGSIALPDVVKGTVSPIIYTVKDVFAIAFADVDAGDTLGGVMLTSNLSTSAQGTWQYHDAVTGWSVIPTNLSNSNAMWLSANAEIRFKPNLSADATVVGALSGRIADSTVGYNSDGTFVSINSASPNGWAWDGATNALSTNVVTLTTNITPLAPVVLDLNQDGVLTYGQSVMDINGDGKLDQTAWAGKDEGVLIWDKYADGQVHDNSQYAFAQYGGKTDLGGLAVKFDTNHDGKFNAQDAQFSQFDVWQDANQNGVSDAGEVYKLSDLGLTSIDLTSDNIVRNPTGGVVEAGRGTADLANGSTMLLSDASFDFTTITDAYTLSLDSQLDLSITTAQPQSTSSLIKLDDVLQMPTVGSLIVDGHALDTSHFSPAVLTTNHDLMLKTTEELMQSAI